MNRLSAASRAALAIATLLAALSLVAWRQARAFEALGELDQVRRQISLAEAERAELYRRLQYLESRGRVVPAARERLGMKTPESSEIVMLNGEAS